MAGEYCAKPAVIIKIKTEVMKKHILKMLAVSAFAVGLLTACDEDLYTVDTQLDEPVYTRSVSPDPTYVWISGDWVGLPMVMHTGRDTGQGREEQEHM
jgi:hypothetical protein